MNEKTKFVPRDYKDPIPGEKIIRRSPSSGFYFVQECDYFYTRKPSKVDELGNNLVQRPSTQYTDPDIVLKCIPEAQVVDKHLVVTQNNNILFGLQYHYLTMPNSKNLQEMSDVDHVISIKFPHPEKKGEMQKLGYIVSKDSESFDEAFFLGETDNFGHWIFEFLPKLLWYKKYLLDANINVPILVGEDVPNRWLEVGEPLGIPPENFQRVKLGKTLKVKKLFICGPAVGRGFDKRISWVSTDDISELRVVFRRHYKLDLIPKTVDILFESRERAGWRKIVNEDVLIERVKEEVGLTTEKFFPETMTFKEQIEKLQSSNIFVGTGASLPFSFFMSRDSLLVEIRNPGGLPFATNISSNIFRIPYYRSKTKITDRNTGSIPMDTDLQIDENEFIESMSLFKREFFPRIV